VAADGSLFAALPSGRPEMRGVKYISWGDNTGYAVAAKSYVRALVELGRLH
jgi:hypothetical protein